MWPDPLDPQIVGSIGVIEGMGCQRLCEIDCKEHKHRHRVYTGLRRATDQSRIDMHHHILGLHPTSVNNSRASMIGEVGIVVGFSTRQSKGRLSPLILSR